MQPSRPCPRLLRGTRQGELELGPRTSDAADSRAGGVRNGRKDVFDPCAGAGDALIAPALSGITGLWYPAIRNLPNRRNRLF